MLCVRLLLVSSAERDSELSGLVLKAGRTLVGLVPELSRLQPFTDDLASACSDATKTGLWSKILTADQPQKMVGGYRLPVNVPERNIPSVVLDDMASRHEGPDGSPALQVARNAAARKGLEIKVCRSWDGGTSHTDVRLVVVAVSLLIKLMFFQHTIFG